MAGDLWRRSRRRSRKLEAKPAARHRPSPPITGRTQPPPHSSPWTTPKTPIPHQGARPNDL